MLAEALILSAALHPPPLASDPPPLVFINLALEYRAVADIRPVVSVRATEPIYLMSYFPRYAAFLQRWDDAGQRWEDAQRPVTCATIKDADVPIRLSWGDEQELATYWQWSVEERDGGTFKVGAFSSQPIAGTYRSSSSSLDSRGPSGTAAPRSTRLTRPRSV